jgi:hypothetical protein
LLVTDLNKTLLKYRVEITGIFLEAAQTVTIKGNISLRLEVTTLATQVFLSRPGSVENSVLAWY